VQQLRTKIQTEVQDQVQQSQRDYYLREQLKPFRKNWASRTRASARPTNCGRRLKPPECRGRKKGGDEGAGAPGAHVSLAADYSLTRNYIEWLPCFRGQKVRIQSQHREAKEILDEDHYELKKVKDRILDYLSVLELKPDMKGRFCACGATGRGQTSLAGPSPAPWPQVPARLAGRHARRGEIRAIAARTSARFGAVIQSIRKPKPTIR